MKHKTTIILFAALAVLCLAGCAGPNKFTSFDRVAPTEAVVIGKMRVLYNGKDITKGSFAIFNAPAFGANKWAGFPDENGYFFARLPLGDVSINFIMHKNGITQHHFPSGELSFQISESRAVYYIGDITLDWRGSGSGGAWVLVAAIGPILTAKATQGQILATVESHPVEAQEAFRRVFPNDRAVKTSLLAVKPSH